MCSSTQLDAFCKVQVRGQSAFIDAGIGEVVEATRGLLDERRLPGVTNGKWKVRGKILDPDRAIPSYIIRKEEAVLSLAPIIGALLRYRCFCKICSDLLRF